MSPQDRRASPRYLPAFDRVRITWMEEARFRYARARLLDLSSGGARIVIAEPLSSQGPVWIGLEGTPIEEWVPADVVRVVPYQGTTWHVGLQFTQPCGPRFFRRAIWGITPGVGGVPAGALPADEPASPLSSSMGSSHPRGQGHQAADVPGRPASGSHA